MALVLAGRSSWPAVSRQRGYRHRLEQLRAAHTDLESCSWCRSRKHISYVVDTELVALDCTSQLQLGPVLGFLRLCAASGHAMSSIGSLASRSSSCVFCLLYTSPSPRDRG
eukprot:4849248-Amphidinium_carterae.1